MYLCKCILPSPYPLPPTPYSIQARVQRRRQAAHARSTLFPLPPPLLLPLIQLRTPTLGVLSFATDQALAQTILAPFPLPLLLVRGRRYIIRAHIAI